MNNKFETNTRDAKSEIINKTLNSLKDLRFGHTDEIPEGMVFSDDLKTGKKYKCRAHFFLNIAVIIGVLEDSNLTTDTDILKRWEEYDKFLVNVVETRAAISHSFSDPNNTRVTREDINGANDILDALIRDVEKLK